MTTTSEKLIRQVSYRIASISNERLPIWPTVGERDNMRLQVAGEIVDLVLSAFRDGRLDEELGVVGRFGVSKHGVTVKHFWEEDVKLWRMELEAINYTGMMRLEYTYYAHNKDDLPWPEGEIHDFDLIALRPLTGTGKEGAIVAASNASEEAKKGADYLCDGVGDEVEIQSAIDAVCKEGTGKEEGK